MGWAVNRLTVSRNRIVTVASERLTNPTPVITLSTCNQRTFPNFPVTVHSRLPGHRRTGTPSHGTPSRKFGSIPHKCLPRTGTLPLTGTPWPNPRGVPVSGSALYYHSNQMLLWYAQFTQYKIESVKQNILFEQTNFILQSTHLHSSMLSQQKSYKLLILLSDS